MNGIKSTSETMSHEKSTTNKERFKTMILGTGADTPPVLEMIYLPKWWIGNAKKIQVTVEVIE